MKDLFTITSGIFVRFLFCGSHGCPQLTATHQLMVGPPGAMVIDDEKQRKYQNDDECTRNPKRSTLVVHAAKFLCIDFLFVHTLVGSTQLLLYTAKHQTAKSLLFSFFSPESRVQISSRLFLIAFKGMIVGENFKQITVFIRYTRSFMDLRLFYDRKPWHPYTRGKCNRSRQSHDT